MFSVTALNPQVDIDVGSVSFNPDSEEYRRYEHELKRTQAAEVSKHVTKEEKLAKELGFDLANIVHGPMVYVRKRMFYQAHAATTHSVEQATNMIDFLGRKYDSEDCLPFAIKIIEGEELISVAEDNGEFSCGKLLLHSLHKVQNFNVLICVTRHVEGSFVSDIVQNQKQRFVKQAADFALDALLKTFNVEDENSPNS